MFQEYSSLFNQPMVPQNGAVNLKPALTPIITSLLLLYISALSLPCKSRTAVFFRLALLPFQMTLAYDICSNKSYSFGSAFRDSAFPSFAFFVIYRALDFSIINLWDAQPAYHWIVPDHSLEEKKNPDSQSALPNPAEKPIRWRKVPHPPLFSFDRMLWALDNLTLMRAGTPFIFPWRIRALEWSQRALESPDLKFGEPEWPLFPAIVQQLIHLLCHLYIRRVDLKAGQSLWDQPLFVQLALSFALGGAVTFSYALEEAIFFPLILRFKLLPRTALVSHSKRAITSAGITDLWSKRWHHIWKRCFVRLAKLIPGSRNRLIHTIGVFWMSAVLHCFLLTRSYPKPDTKSPTTFLPLIFEPGVYIFFLGQGLGVVLEQLILGDAKKGEKLTIKVIRIVWLYSILMGFGRYSTNALALKGLLDRKQWDTISLPAIAKMFYHDVFQK